MAQRKISIAQPSDQITAPSAKEVLWLAVVGDAAWLVRAKTWHEARAKAAAEYGCEPGDVRLTLDRRDRT